MKDTFLRFTLPVVGEVTFPAYMTLLMIGFGLAIWLARRDEERGGRDGVKIVDLSLVMLVMGILGARLLSVLADGHLHDFINICVAPRKVPVPDPAFAHMCTTDAQCGPYQCNPGVGCYPHQDCLEVLKFWHGGLAYYGGLLLAAPTGLWLARKWKLGVWRVADLTAPLIAFGLFFGRMGCFFNGCCYGRTTDVPWGMTFPHLLGHRHPTQLYESIGSLVVYAILYFVVRPRKRAHGEVFAGLLVLYGALRFVCEIWRDDERGIFGPLSTSQWISIPLILAGIAIFVIKRTHAGAPRLAPAPAA